MTRRSVRRLSLLVSLAALAGCGSSLTPSGPVEIRVANESAFVYDEVIIGFPDGPQSFGTVAPGERSDYRRISRAYHYAYVELLLGDSTFQLVPIDYVGESLLPAGRYTYRLTLEEGAHAPGLTLVHDER